MGRDPREIRPPTTLVDEQYALTTITDFVNLTVPEFHAVPQMKVQLDSIEAELKIQLKEVSNISVHVKGLKEHLHRVAESKDQTLWTRLPLLLHAMHFMFVFYLVLQCVNCTRKR